LSSDLSAGSSSTMDSATTTGGVTAAILGERLPPAPVVGGSRVPEQG
jgi:hypothetical protein